MYCGKCGTENAEGVNYCKECGAPMNGKAAQFKPTLNLQTLGIAAVAIIAVIAIVVCMGFPGGSSSDADAMAVRMMEAMFEPNTRLIFDMMPDAVLNEEMEMDLVGDSILNDTCEALDNALRLTCGSLEDMEITCTAVDHLDISGTDLVMIVDTYRRYDLEVTEACVVTVEVTVTTADDSGTSSFSIPLVQIGNEWYLDYTNMDGLLY